MAGRWAPYGPHTGVHEQVMLNTINEHDREKGELHKQIADLKRQHASEVAQKENHQRAAGEHKNRHDAAEKEIARLEGVLTQLQIEHEKCGERLEETKTSHQKILENVKGENKKVNDTLQSRYNTLQAQMTEKDRRHGEEIRSLKSEKANLEAQLRQASALHKDIKKARDGHADELARHQRNIDEKDQLIATLSVEIRRLGEELRLKEIKVQASKNMSRRLVLENMKPVAIQTLRDQHTKELNDKELAHMEALNGHKQESAQNEALLKKTHDMEMARREQEYTERLEGVKNNVREVSGAQPTGAQPATPKIGIIGRFFGRGQTAHPTNSQMQSTTNQRPPPTAPDFVPLDYQYIYNEILREETEKYDRDNGYQQARIEPSKRAIRKNAILKAGEARFITSQGGRTPKGLNLVKNSIVVNTLRHFTFNNNDGISNGGSSSEGGLYIARSR